MNRKVLLSVDTEGSREQIERIVELLDKKQIMVTFFVVGITCEEYPSLFQGIASRYVVESHSYSHRNLRRMSKSEQKADILKGRTVVERIIGRKTYGFKAPRHLLNKETVEILNELDFKYDVSSLYFKYNMGKIVAFAPSWFREWTPFYEVNPRVCWYIFKLLYKIKNILSLAVHPQYTGSSQEKLLALEDFINFVKKHNGQFVTYRELLNIPAFE